MSGDSDHMGDAMHDFHSRDVEDDFDADRRWNAEMQRRALRQDRIALAKLTDDIRAYFRLKSEMDRMVQYGRDPGEEAYDRLCAMRAQLPS